MEGEVDTCCVLALVYSCVKDIGHRYMYMYGASPGCLS